MIQRRSETSGNLLHLLFKDDYDPVEFATVLTSYFGRSSGTAEETSFGDQDSPSLRARWNKKGALLSLDPGPLFDLADVPRLQVRLAAALETKTKVARRFVVMTRRRVEGAIGFPDWFVMTPAPQHAPRPAFGFGGGNPAIMEVLVTATADSSVMMSRANQAMNELELVLAAFLKDQIERPPIDGRFHWVLDNAELGKPVHAQAHYALDGFVNQAADLSDIKPFPSIRHIDPNDYYASGLSAGNSLELPETLPTLLTIFRSLDENARKTFLRAAYWSKAIPKLWAVSQSAAYAASVRAIETLMPVAPAGMPCDSCGNPPSQKTRQTFADFVDGLTAGQIPRKQRLDLYDRRSRLVHGGAILLRDEDVFCSSPSYLRESTDQYFLTDLVYIVLHNWMLAQHHSRGDVVER